MLIKGVPLQPIGYGRLTDTKKLCQFGVCLDAFVVLDGLEYVTYISHCFTELKLTFVVLPLPALDNFRR